MGRGRGRPTMGWTEPTGPLIARPPFPRDSLSPPERGPSPPAEPDSWAGPRPRWPTSAPGPTLPTLALGDAAPPSSACGAAASSSAARPAPADDVRHGHSTSESTGARSVAAVLTRMSLVAPPEDGEPLPADVEGRQALISTAREPRPPGAKRRRALTTPGPDESAQATKSPSDGLVGTRNPSLVAGSESSSTSDSSPCPHQ